MSNQVQGPTILYVEDNEVNMILVQRIMEAEGYRVVGALDGPTGIELAKAERPDLILMDINLPEMDGFEVTSRLRAMEEFQTVPIIALTANVMKGDREKTLQAGCTGYIEKPIDVDRLPVQLAAFL
jgi:two-component system cell cycle response regulator DivK